ncbi:unnamed protein product [Pylaiella littoralis]
MPPNSSAAPARGIKASMSTRAFRAESRPDGSLVWTEDTVSMWVLVEVIAQDNTLLRVRNKKTGSELEIDLGFGEAHPHNPKVVADMTSLHHIHEAGILHNLGQRAELKNQRPYTFMGTILIAVNPLRRVPNPAMEDFMNRPLNPESPHPYAIAELSYHQMRLGAGRKAANQSIIVSGESGAGKTESSKIILKFLTHRSVGVEGAMSLEQKVVDSSPILESFGNAKTLRNDNSSRFGKFLKMQFTKDKYHLAGAFIETYLLEKSRVLTQGRGERNFHILYELVAGAAKCGFTKDLQLGGLETYRVLSDSGCTELEGVDDAVQFEGVRTACGTIGLDEGTQMQVWKALAAVLHMSNMAFDGKDHAQGEVAAVRESAALERLSALLGVTAPLVESMLTQRVVKTRGEVFTKQLEVQDANLTRDAIVKSLYEALFLWIVRVINKSLGKGNESLPFIGVLDIFGFENFEYRNEFEQLLINFTNESLQDTFNKQVFSNELRLYEEEGISVTVSSCPDNAECLELLSSKPKGIIPSLDCVCSEPKPTDARFLDGLHKTYVRHQHFPRTKPKDMRECFSVKHYAGTVKYTVESWVDRNMDNIPTAFAASLSSSSHKVVRDMLEGYGVPAPAAAAASGAPRRSSQSLVRPTVAKAFLASMRGLNATLLETTCNFVRCIKPNADMKCGVYDNRYVVEQLQCLGILQTCEVLKVGMPTRVTYKELKEVLGDKAAEADKLFKGEPETALIASILWAFEVPSEAFRLGNTRVFFRAGQISTLQKILNETGPDKAPWILERLKEALAGRQEAKAAAEEAQVAMSAAAASVKEAQKASAAVLGRSSSSSRSSSSFHSDTEATTTSPPSDEDTDDDGVRLRPLLSPPVSAVGEADLRSLGATAKKAKVAGSTVPQIEAMVAAAREDRMGRYVAGLMDRLIAGSKDAVAKIEEAAQKGAELEKTIADVRGGDEATALKRLSDMLRGLHSEMKGVGRLAQSAVEAAAKCQVEKTRDLTTATKSQASKVEIQARELTNLAKGAAQASERQQAAFVEAKAKAEDTEKAGEQAKAAFSFFRELLQKATDEEEAARAAKLSKADADAKLREQQTMAEAAACAAAAAASEEKEEASAKARPPPAPGHEEETKTKEQGDQLSELILPSEAPADRRMSAISRVPSLSVHNLLKSSVAKSPVPSPTSGPSSPSGFGSTVEMFDGPRPGEKPTHHRSPSEHFREAMEDGYMEGYLMSQSKMLKRWTPRYFVLDNGYLSHFEKKSLVGTKKKKAMELQAHSVTRPANQANTFGIRTGSTEWLLLARSKREMNDWMEAITDQIHALFIREYSIPGDDYRNEGKWGQFFYKMAKGARPQWIRTFPVPQAPHTGDGLFEGEVIEVTQVLNNNGVEFLRMANDRGWTFAHDTEAGDGKPLFVRVSGDLVEETRQHEVPRIAKGPAVVLFGPSLESQETGATMMPGASVKVVQRFTSAEEGESSSGQSFVKLKKSGGWVPIMSSNGVVGVRPLQARR